MLDHFRISGQDILPVKGSKKIAINKNTFRRIKRTYLILQSVKVDTGFAAYRRIDRSHKGSRNIERKYTTFKCSTCKSTHIGNHSTTQIDKKRMAGSTLIG